MTPTHDLHLHLYGCLSADDLWDLAQSKPHIDWSPTEQSYFEAFGIRPNFRAILAQPEFVSRTRFAEFFLVQHPMPFAQFQAKFNIIIAIANLELPDEIADITQRICQQHFQEGLSHAEYRMLFPPWVSEGLWCKLVTKICHALQDFEDTTERSFEGRFSLSLSRQNELGLKHYQQLRQLMKEDPIVARMTTSVDFCFFEEGYPPKDKHAFFQQILQDNQAYPEHALAILYHVGESFADKSLESAIRWIHESALFGAHRLGHAIALGIPPSLYQEQSSQETTAERLDQIAYDLQHSEALKAFGVAIDHQALEEERQHLEEEDLQEIITQPYTAERLKALEGRQHYVMSQLKANATCIEVCPSSNLRIGLIQDTKDHPIHRFLEQEAPFTLGSDDPGIFNTSLATEFQWTQEHTAITQDQLEQLIKKTPNFRSEVVSGRIK